MRTRHDCARLEEKLTRVLRHLHSKLGRYPAEVAIPGGFHAPSWCMKDPIPPIDLLAGHVLSASILVNEICDSNGLWAYRLNRGDDSAILFDADACSGVE